jgi:hypothetical protein
LDIRKCNNRDIKREKRRSGMRIDGKGIFIIQQKQYERAQEIKRKREQKEKELKLEDEAVS